MGLTRTAQIKMKITKNFKKEPLSLELKNSKATKHNRNEKRKLMKVISKKNQKIKKTKLIVKLPESMTKNAEIYDLKEENQKLKEYNFQLCQLLHKYDQFLLKQRPKEYEIDAMGIAALTKATQPRTQTPDSTHSDTALAWDSSSSGLSDLNDDLSDLFPNFEPKTTVFHQDKNGNETKTPTPTEDNLPTQFTLQVNEPSPKPANKGQVDSTGGPGANTLKEPRRCKHCGREFTWGGAHKTHENSCNGINNAKRKCDKCDFSVTGTIRECNDQLFRHIRSSHSEIVRRKPKPEKRKMSNSGASSEELETETKNNTEKASLALVSDYLALVAHQEDDRPKNIWQCHGCLHIFSELGNLKRHQKTVPNCSKRQKFSCEFCDDFTTSTQSILTRHLHICRKSPFQKFK